MQGPKNICLAPDAEWGVIAGETTSTGALITGYVLPLAAISAVAGFVGGSVIGRTLPFVGYYRVSMVAGITGAIITLVMAVVGVFVMSLIVNALAPTFGGEKNSMQAMKVVAYSYTPAWLTGILLVLPLLGTLATLVGGLFGLYLLYLGLPKLMKAPQDKAIAYTAVSIVCAIVVSVVLAGVSAAVVGAGMVAGGGLGALGSGGSSPTVQYDPNSPLGRLQDLGNKLEENNKKVEAAQNAGDQAGAAAAALGGLGLLVGGGTHVEPVSTDTLKPLVPAQFAGLRQNGGTNTERGGLPGFMVATAKARYSDESGKSASLEITDTGGASGLVGLAGWAAGIQGEKEDDNSIERTGKVDGRLVHEKSSKTGGTNEYSIVLADRFVVNAEGQGVDLNQLKSAVSSLDLGKIESLK